jgi:hypothetical protein
MGNFCGFLRFMLFLTSPASPASSKLLGMILHTAFFIFALFLQWLKPPNKVSNIDVNENWGLFLTNIAACLDARLISQ